jgi:hypothetical protein
MLQREEKVQANFELEFDAVLTCNTTNLYPILGKCEFKK